MKIIPINKCLFRHNVIHNAILFISTNNHFSIFEFEFLFYKLNKIHNNKYPAIVKKRKFCDILKAYFWHGKIISYRHNTFKRYKREEKLKVFK